MMLHEKIREIVEQQRAKAAADTLTLEEFLHNCRQLLDLTEAVEFLERHAAQPPEVPLADLATGKVVLFAPARANERTCGRARNPRRTS